MVRFGLGGFNNIVMFILPERKDRHARRAARKVRSKRG